MHGGASMLSVMMKLTFVFSIMHPHTGYRQFPERISKVKQVTGELEEHRDIQRYIIALIADAVPPKTHAATASEFCNRLVYCPSQTLLYYTLY
jgi:hypothetical protein